MTDTLHLPMDGAEAHVLEAALVIYRDRLTESKALGGAALDAAVLLDGPAARVQARLHALLYAVRFDGEGVVTTGEYPDPEVVPYHDWQTAS